MKYFSTVFLSVSVLALGACDHYSQKFSQMEDSFQNESSYEVAATSHASPADIEPAAGVASGIDSNAQPFQNQKTFAQHLKEGYMAQARLEQSSYDYKSAKYCTEKVYALSNGQLVAPTTLTNKGLSAEDKKILSAAREELINAIKTKNIPQNRFTLASAQVNFDCWVDHVTENKMNSPCKATFMQSMDSIIDPNFSEERYNISFDPQTGKLTELDKESLQVILEFYSSNSNDVYKIMLVGNQSEEAQKQMAAVESILKYNGVPPHKISQGTLEGATNVGVIVQKKSPTIVNAPVEARIYEQEHSTTVLQEQSSFY